MSFKQLTWGVKESFRGYVEGMGGSITLSDGATRADDGTFVFKAVPGGDLNIIMVGHRLSDRRHILLAIQFNRP